MKYGSREWLESLYRAVSNDPWGLDWRYSQFFRYHRMIKALSEVVDIEWHDKKVLDVGSATGEFTALLQANLLENSGLLVGIDIAPSAVARASEKFPHIQFQHLEISECGARFPGQFDLVTCLEVLYYMSAEDRKSAVRDIRQLLKPGGVFLVSSMIGAKPYLTLSALEELVATEFSVIFADTLYLKPTILAEKLLIRTGLSKNRARYGHDMTVDAKCLGHIAKREKQYRRFLGSFARSHGYVIARVADRCS